MKQSREPNHRKMGSRKTPKVSLGDNALLYHQGVEVKPQTIYAMDRIIPAFHRRRLSVVWTSIVRAESGRFSLHPYGYAVDADTDRELPNDVWNEIREETIVELGDAYDIIVHNAGSGMHLHGEFDPEDDPGWVKWKARARDNWEERQ